VPRYSLPKAVANLDSNTVPMQILEVEGRKS